MPRQRDRLDVVPVSAVEACALVLPWPDGDLPAVSERGFSYVVGGHPVVVRFVAVPTSDRLAWRWECSNRIVMDAEWRPV